METISDLNPSTGECLAEINCAGPAEVNAAVARARAAWPAWRGLSIEERCTLLARGAERLGEQAAELGELIAREMGKPRQDGLGEVRAYAAHVPKELEEVRAALAPQKFSGKDATTTLVREAHGVVAAITPWNFPVGMPLGILVPALAAGNTVVLKPSEHVPLCGAAIFECFGAFLPEGVLELVQGDGASGAALVEADIDMVGFVGSRETGMAIMAAAASGLKRLVLELGGKDPLVVFADADLEAAADIAVRHSVRNTGQVCCGLERIFVEAAALERFTQLVQERAGEWTHGDPLAENGAAPLGPMVSRAQRDKVARQVEAAVADGAQLLVGGVVPEGPGAFYPATVLAGVTPQMTVYREETFGPVVALMPFDGSEAEAIRLANDTPFGLGANVFSGDLPRARRVAADMRAGQVGVNRYLGSAPGTPWVGARHSGFGFLGGVEGHRQFTWPKSISE
ncbi:MAG: aldehyde dehydrogenase [Planctomycetes bacterium]|jgi:acyl-CoA reductase-like NAD-dependent aldehyde dehydrogenase|nr:aldehyde dehydrogenase [Planctomycetota bacterium]HJO26597.1 aldehyde dehydrogenase family protein [Planctomycetota bacterium]